uniref:ATPase AAA-type core domain-containing protein n=1 Tax=Zea mays TaxID=4577 RepID=C0PAR9_MAIZE|nr:unknown [Zea mays]
MNTDIQQRLRVSSMDEDDKMMVSMDEGDEMLDVYQGTEFKWCLVCKDNSNDSLNSSQNESHFFELTFNKKHKDKALRSYLPFILATAKAIKAQERTLMIHMTEYGNWSPIELHHPSTFDTLAMDKKLKQSIIDDLLYGPPGTGKSSLIAAMANHLRFDIYDLELTAVTSNSDLRRLLVNMDNRSILVIEDIDCTIELKQRQEAEGHDESDSTEQNKGEGKVSTIFSIPPLPQLS